MTKHGYHCQHVSVAQLLIVHLGDPLKGGPYNAIVFFIIGLRRPDPNIARMLILDRILVFVSRQAAVLN